MDLETKILKLGDYLRKILQINHCYYSPPTGMEMEYPCIVYELNDGRNFHADNLPYIINLQWTVTIIDEDPASDLFNKMLHVSGCSFDRSFSKDNLNHFIFTLYF